MDFVQFSIFASMEKNKTGIATVVKHTGSHYMLSRLPAWDVFPAVITGKLRLKDFNSTNPIAVGDRVEFESPEGGGTSVIKSILPRKNCIIRKSANLSRQSHVIASNLDRVFLVVTLKHPEVKMQFVDRFLVTCQAYNVPVTILINKTDLYGEEEKPLVEKLKEIYGKAGYEIMELSAATGENTGLLKEACNGRIVLFSGQSGVGKSSIINALDPTLTLRTEEISEYHLQGKHTTTFYEMHPLSSGGFVIDMPGIRGFGLVNVAKEELSTYFPEMLRVEDDCRFIPCTHTHEPGCAVKEAVEKGMISVERYESYLGMLEEEGKYR